ncbi:hypothetical protein PSTT_07315 [Puccinia striiformis]|uniref:CHCH domain-containing protein n=1 Tax=Puccinia striiformis TaxID=27350 RepID=A0A2S4VH60_9BASI|nr:hypothetical protein PSTT_07315 [Puccinia striiformis]
MLWSVFFLFEENRSSIAEAGGSLRGVNIPAAAARCSGWLNPSNNPSNPKIKIKLINNTEKNQLNSFASIDYPSHNSNITRDMSFGRPGNFRETFTVSPPDRGSFPLDHFHDCSSFMKTYLSCLQANQRDQAKCRLESKNYLGVEWRRVSWLKSLGTSSASLMFPGTAG